ncbi:MAG: haloacid dehalogenase type II [Bacteroidetes bacterium]|jgi:2-haloacid dehalogenase|nr:haloacid dehalogenase type II [Bacteroidota bacterium]
MSNRALIVDVNGTLLDLSALDPFFSAYRGDAALRKVWFRQVKEWWLVGLGAGVHRDFGTLAQASLAALAPDAPPTTGEVDALMAGVTSLPAFPDVPYALGQLRAGGVRLVALTNGTAAAVAQQLDHAGLDGYFSHVLSAEAVGQHKPGPRPYLHAADVLGVAPADCVMVAAHDWDIHGADAAGLSTVFVARPGASYSPLYPAPDHRIETLDGLLPLVGDGA